MVHCAVEGHVESFDTHYVSVSFYRIIFRSGEQWGVGHSCGQIVTRCVCVCVFVEVVLVFSPPVSVMDQN